MKTYIKTFLTAAATGFILSELIHYIASICIGKPFAASSIALIIALIALIVCCVYEVINQRFLAVTYKEIYRKGYVDGTKVNKYKIIIPEESK